MDLAEFGLVHHHCKTVKVGDVFSRLTVVAIGKPPGTYKYKAVVRCECGPKLFTVLLNGLVLGTTKGCGCLRGGLTHGLTNHPLYNVWNNMISRCTDPKSRAFKNYGARGIKVCERWMDITNFIADMPSRPSAHHELDRKDNDGNYELGNCRWATLYEQQNNRRITRLFTHQGAKKSLPDWARAIGVSPSTLRKRIFESGWSIEKALSTPLVDKSESIQIARASRWRQ